MSDPKREFTFVSSIDFTFTNSFIFANRIVLLTNCNIRRKVFGINISVVGTLDLRIKMYRQEKYPYTQ